MKLLKSPTFMALVGLLVIHEDFTSGSIYSSSYNDNVTDGLLHQALCNFFDSRLGNEHQGTIPSAAKHSHSVGGSNRASPNHTVAVARTLNDIRDEKIDASYADQINVDGPTFGGALNQLPRHFNFEDDTPRAQQNYYYRTPYKPTDVFRSNQPSRDADSNNNMVGIQSASHYSRSSYEAPNVLYPDRANVPSRTSKLNQLFAKNPSGHDPVNTPRRFNHYGPLGDYPEHSRDYQLKNDPKNRVHPVIDDTIITDDHQLTALGAPFVAVTLPKISAISPDVQNAIKRLKFCAPTDQRLVRQPIPMEASNSKSQLYFKGFLYSTFSKILKKPPVWGAIGESNSYSRSGKSATFFFEMIAGSDPPMGFKDRIGSNLSEFREMFKNAKWCINIKASGKIVKIGKGNPSSIITLWSVIDGKTDEIKLKDQEISLKLPLKKGDLIVAVPTQLNFILERADEQVTYDTLLSLIKPYTDLDILFFIAEVCRGIPTQTTSNNMRASNQVDTLILDDSSNQSSTGSNLPGRHHVGAPGPLEGPLRLTRISSINFDVNKRIIRSLGFSVPATQKLAQRLIPVGEPVAEPSFKGVIYCTFYKRTSESVLWGRIGERGLHIRATNFIISLFEMEPGSQVPTYFQVSGKLRLSQLQERFKDAKWSIHINPGDDELVETGSAPLRSMALWIVTSENVEQIIPSNRDTLRKLNLQRKSLIVAIPSQLNDVMSMITGERTYDAFLKFIKPHIDVSLDQLIFIVETNGELTTQMTPNGMLSAPIDMSFSDQLLGNVNFTDNTTNAQQIPHYSTYYGTTSTSYPDEVDVMSPYHLHSDRPPTTFDYYYFVKTPMPFNDIMVPSVQGQDQTNPYDSNQIYSFEDGYKNYSYRY